MKNIVIIKIKENSYERPYYYWKSQSIIALNKFKDGDFVCDDKEINDVLAYNKITRDDTENNQ